jgi:hypothetical protein
VCCARMNPTLDCYEYVKKMSRSISRMVVAKIVAVVTILVISFQHITSLQNNSKFYIHKFPEPT